MTANPVDATDTRDVQIRTESIETVERMWRETSHALNWGCLFTLPLWTNAWLSSCGEGVQAKFVAVRRGRRLLGVAPLHVAGATAGLIGSPDVCDYLDFIVAEGAESEFYGALLAHLSEAGFRKLELGPMREDSPALRDLPAIAERSGWMVHREEDEHTFEMSLPTSWEDYLAGLKSKQRHEVRRKLRRLSESGEFQLRQVVSSGQLESHFDTFLTLFRRSREDKNEFLTHDRLSFFRQLSADMAAAGMLRLFFLILGGRPAACALCFDYGDTLYLYNSGYDRRFAALSVGQACTFLTIKAAIAEGRKRYSFLKGDEVYKKRLGGRPVRLLRLTLTK